MPDILRNYPPEKQQWMAWVLGLGLSMLISVTMILGNSGEVDTKLILKIDPMLLLLGQGIFSSFLFLGIPALVIGLVLRTPLSDFFPKISWQTAALTLLITICFMVVNSAIGEWNMNLDFGDSDFAKWARRAEDQLKVITEHVTNITSTGHFLMAFLVVGIIPAVGEELLFRGLIQNFFHKAFKNPHAAIWFTGLLFAAIHVQFFGLAPRMFLGVLFGYLYHWSGKLSVAMLGHLTNNGLAIIALYMAKQGLVEIQPEDMDQAAPWPLVFLFGSIGAFCLRAFYKKYAHA